MTKAESDARGGVPALAVRRETIDAGFLVWLRERRWWVFGFLVLLYCAAFNGQWRISDDGGWYVYWAHAVGGGAGAPKGVPPHFYPGLPWLLAGTFRVFGADQLLAAHLVMLGLGAAGLGLTYGLMRRFTGVGVAWMVTLMVGVNHTYFEQGYRLLSDLPFAVGVLLLLYGYERISHEERGGMGRRPGAFSGWFASVGGWLLVAGGIVMMMTMRRAAWVVLAAVGVGVCLQMIRGGGRRLWMAAGLGASVALGVGLFLIIDPRPSRTDPTGVYVTDFLPWDGGGVGVMAERVFAEWIPKFLHEVAVTVSYGMELGPGLDLTLGLVPIVAAVAVLLGRGRLMWGVLVGVYVAACAVKSPTERYFLPVIPFLAMGWWYFMAGLARRFPPHVGPYVFWLGLAVWFVPNVVKDVGLIMEQRRTPFLEHYDAGRYAGLDELGRWVRDHVESGAVLFAEHPVPLTHFAQRWDIERRDRLARILRVSPRFVQWHALGDADAIDSAELQRRPGSDWFIEGAGDFTGDGRPDLLWRNHRTGENSVWHMRGTIKIGSSEIDPVSPDWYVGGVTDFTGDGRPDLLWRNRRTYQNTIWHMDGTTRTGSTNPGGSGKEWLARGVADFTDDGHPDILWRHERTGQTGAWPMNGPEQRIQDSGKGAWFTLPIERDLDWRIVGAISFPGEAGDHVLWRNHKTGENRLWLVEGRKRIDAVHLPSLHPDWRVGAVADLDGDGAADILWRNQRTGRNTLWRVRSVVYVASASEGPADEKPAVELGPTLKTVDRGAGRSPWTLRRVPVSGMNSEK